MNNVSIKDNNIVLDTYKNGDIFYISEHEYKSYYILSYINNKLWVAIALHDGVNWGVPCENILDAVDGLNFIGRNMKITLSKNQD